MILVAYFVIPKKKVLFLHNQKVRPEKCGLTVKVRPEKCRYNIYV